MARAKPVTSMPFPGESPTVSLAMAAGQMYGLPDKEAAGKKKAAPKRASKARAAKPARKKSR